MKADRLTVPQSVAVQSTARKILVVAGPGSGKTATSVTRIARLLAAGVEPGRIAALTFTNAAAREFENRLSPSEPEIEDLRKDFPGVKRVRLGYCGTLHGFALRCLKKHGGGFGYGERMAVINPESSAALLESKNRQIGSSKRPMKALLALKALGRPKRPHLVDEIVVASYFDEIREAGIVDFDVLLTEFARALIEDDAFRLAIDREFSHLFVDEVQDSGAVDWAIYNAIAIENKFFVGDPDQSIYGFRGAALLEMLTYSERPDVVLVKLEENFRSLTSITEAAQRLIEHNVGRVDKVTRSAVGVGGLVWVRRYENEGSEIAELAGAISLEISPGVMKPHEIAVLARTNAIAKSLEIGLEAAGIPVAKRVDPNLPPDLGFVRSLVVYLCNVENDTLGYFYLLEKLKLAGRTEKEAKEQAHSVRLVATKTGRSINAANFGFPRSLHADAAPEVLGKHGATREALMLVAEKLRELPDGALMIELAHALSSDREAPGDRLAPSTGVNVITLHASKGREFDVVYLAGFEDEVTPGRRQDADVEEERRLAYVGITRARKVVWLTSSKTRTTQWNGIEPRTPSRFTEEIKPR